MNDTQNSSIVDVDQQIDQQPSQEYRSPVVKLTRIDTTNSTTSAQMNKNTSKVKAYISSEIIEQIIEDTKVVYPDRYRTWREFLETQLEYTKAVENRSDRTSLYNNKNYKPSTRLLENLLKEEKSKKKTSSGSYHVKVQNMIKFLELEIKNERAFINNSHHTSPYYDATQAQEIQDIMNKITEDQIKILERKLLQANLEESKKMARKKQDTNGDFMLDHIQTLFFIQDAEIVRQERTKKVKQLTPKEVTPNRKQSNLETAKQLQRTFLNSSIAKNKQEKTSSTKTTPKIMGIEKLPFEKQETRLNQLEKIPTKQLIKEYKILIQQNSKDCITDAENYLETIFSRAQNSESLIMRYQNEVNKDKQSLEDELELRNEELLKEITELNTKLRESSKLEMLLEEKLEEKRIENKKLKEELNSKAEQIIEQHKIKELEIENGKLRIQIQELQTKSKVKLKEKKNQTENKTSSVILQTELSHMDITNLEQNQELDIIEINAKLKKIESLVREGISKPEQTDAEGSIKENEQKELRTSNSAIIIRTTSKELTATQLRNFLNEKLLEESDIPPIYCRMARQKDTIILQTNQDNNTEKLLKYIENYLEIKEKIEITYKLTRNLKIIITGIPSTTPTAKILEYIKETTADCTITLEKIIKKENSSNYQMILNLDYNDAQKLLAKKSLLVGLNNCRIRIYRPIIRCGNCQLYGHSSANCRRESICAKCSRGHNTGDCPYANDRSQYRCTNCYTRTDYVPHTADSSSCPLYQSQLFDRRKLN